MINTEYDKVLVISDNGKPKNVIIHDTTAHTPTFYKLEKMSMDEVQELLKTNSEKKA